MTRRASAILLKRRIRRHTREAQGHDAGLLLLCAFFQFRAYFRVRVDERLDVSFRHLIQRGLHPLENQAARQGGDTRYLGRRFLAARTIRDILDVLEDMSLSS